MSNVSLVNTDQGVWVHVPMVLKKRSGRKQIIVPDGLDTTKDSAPDYHEAMVIAISRAHRWKKMLDEGKYGSIRELAAKLRLPSPYVSRLIRLTLLAPDIIEAIIDGREPDGMSLEKLRKPMPTLWEEQRELLMDSAIGSASP